MPRASTKVKRIHGTELFSAFTGWDDKGQVGVYKIALEIRSVHSLTTKSAEV